MLVKGGLGSFLFSRVCKLGLEVVKKVDVGVFNVVYDGVELFYALEHCFYPSVDFGSLDKHKGNGYTVPSKTFLTNLTLDPKPLYLLI